MRRLPASVGWTLLAVVTCAAIIVPFLLWEAELSSWSRTLLDSRLSRPLIAVVVVLLLFGDLFLPVPSSFVSAGAVALLGPWLGGFVIWLGMSLGALVGFFLGRSGGVAAARLVVGERELERAERLMRRFGGWVIVLCRGVPVLAEASTLLAGTARMPFGWFSLLCLAANAGIAAAYGWLAYLGSSETMALVVPFALGVLVPALAIAVVKSVDVKSSD